MVQTALVLTLDDAEPFEAVRRRFAPWSVARGIPFHITLLHPFAPRDELDDALLADIRAFFEAQTPLAFALTRVAAWPTVIYAVPEPDTELIALMTALHRRFPQWPPYEGMHDTLVPHATLGAEIDAEAVRPGVKRHLAPHLPHACFFDTATLLEEYEPDRWGERERFALGG